MKASIIIFSILLVIVAARTVRQKRQQLAAQQESAAYALPDGIEFILNAPLTTNFRCEGPGYFADVDNNCQIFHICDAQTFPDGSTDLRQYTFACGNQTIFNQFSLTCATPDESVPCEAAPQFYRLNERIGQPQALLHQEEDVADFARYVPVARAATRSRRA